MLEQRLREKLGSAVEIWKDEKKLRFGQNWQAEIEQGIGGAAAFLAILSPSYRTSAWCTRERKRFTSQFASFDDMKVGDRYRLLKIIKTAWENNEHREFLSQLEDIAFFRSSGGQDDSEFLPGSPEFDRKVRECAMGIASLLIQIRRNREQVFIASPAEDCYTDSEDLKKELRDLGYDVRPDGLLDDSFSPALLKREMEKAQLTVHLVGAAYDTFVERQMRLAAECEKKMLFWLSKGALETTDARQKNLVESIRKGENLPQKFDLLEGVTPRGMIDYVVDGLKPHAQPAARVGRQDGCARIYLLCDPTVREDAAFAAQLQGQIQAREPMKVELPQAGMATPSAFIERHKQMLRDCDGALLYRELAPPQWLLQTAPDVLLAEFQLGRPPIRSKAFLLNDPNIMPGLPNVIRRSAQFTIGDLEPFLAPLRDPAQVHAGN